MSPHHHLFLTLLSLSLPSTAQWIYPPPLPSGTTLSSYANSTLTSPLTYGIHDTILGNFTPSSVPLYILYRCAHPPLTTPIAPSNLTYTSATGILAHDNTWEYPYTYLSSAYSNAFTPGQNLLYFTNFPTPNRTVGPLCWFELSTGSVKTSADPPFNSEITLNGEETGVRFVSMPFNVVVREGNITWTLGGGGGNENASEAVTSAVGFTISAGSAPTATAIGTAAVKSGGAGGKSSAGNRSSWTAIYSVALLWPVVIIAYAL